MNNRRGDEDFPSLWIPSSEILVAHYERKMRQEKEGQVIRINTKLRAALNKCPGVWINGIYSALALKGQKKKKDKIEHICQLLPTEKMLIRVLNRIPEESIRALRCLMDKGGWIRYGYLSKIFGSEDEDSWWWEDKPPTSILGQLRLYGLLFVGRTPLKNRLCKVAVVPIELRESLGNVLKISSKERIMKEFEGRGREIKEVIKKLETGALNEWVKLRDGSESFGLEYVEPLMDYQNLLIERREEGERECWVLEILARIAKRNLDYLLSICRNPSHKYWLNAMDVIDFMEGEEIEKMLREFLSSKNIELIRRGLLALGRIGNNLIDKDIYKKIIPFLKSRDEEIRAQAVFALYQILGKKARPYIEPMVKVELSERVVWEINNFYRELELGYL